MVCKVFEADEDLVFADWEESEGGALIWEICLKRGKRGTILLNESLVCFGLGELRFGVKVEGKEILRAVLDFQLLLSLEGNAAFHFKHVEVVKRSWLQAKSIRVRLIECLIDAAIVIVQKSAILNELNSGLVSDVGRAGLWPLV